MKKLKLDFTDLSMDAKWYDYFTGEVVPGPDGDSSYLEIRPFPSEMATMQVLETGIMISGKQQKEIYDYCLTGWHNIIGGDDQPLDFTPEVKDKVFEFKLGDIPNFVLNKSREYHDRKAASEKN